MSSYFGDYEWDIGKSVRWFQYFCDTEYAMDINLGKSRRYLLSWTKSFPNVAFSYNSVFPFFENKQTAAQWRFESFLEADKAWDYDGTDWVVFVDCSEGLAVDTVTSPLNVGGSEWDILTGTQFEGDNDPLTPFGKPPSNLQEGDLLPPPSTALEDANPFKDYVVGEVDAAELLGGIGVPKVLYLPVWAYVGDTAPYTVDLVIDQELQDRIDAGGPGDLYDGLTASEAETANTSITTTAQSKYVFAGYLPRAFRVDYLRNTLGATQGTEWSDLSISVQAEWEKLDDFVSSPINSGAEWTPRSYLSLITYAYARWSNDQSKMTWDRKTTDEATDDGWEMRKKISNVRSLVGKGFQTADWNNVDNHGSIEWGWQPEVLEISNASSDTTGSVENQYSSAFSASFLNFERDPHEVSTGLWPSGFPQIGTPLYDNIFRDNPRDGLFYEDDELGPVPWNFIVNVPAVDEDEWREAAANKDPLSQRYAS